MNNLYLFTGVNKFAIDEKIKQLLEEGNVNDLSLVKYDLEEVTIDEVLNDCETLPFLSDQKFIIINQVLFLSAENSKLDHNIDRFMEYLDNPNPTTVLIINCSDIKLDRKRNVVKKVLEKAEIYEYDNLNEEEARELIVSYLAKHNVKIHFDALNELIIRTECDALKLNSELHKLSFYLENKTEITVDDIKLLVAEPLEHNIFTLTNNFLERKIEDSLKIYHQLLLFNEEPIVFSAILGKNFHNLYVIKQYQKKSFTEYQLRNVLKIHPYQLKILYQIAQKTKESDIVRNIFALHEYDINVKCGKVDKYLGFEMLILNM